MKKKNKDITRTMAISRNNVRKAVKDCPRKVFGKKFVETWTKNGKRFRVVKQYVHDIVTLETTITRIAEAKLCGPKFN